ncbi:MAG: SDR family NAD(P)-dependent oxidoreductase [Alphaproteobacteria bacterium]|nr:SDR family NAD(P)-dependent oxidoreductase [Alphaproteobacteria bacterium]
MRDLENKTAIVTGASRGIGAATARELAARGAAVLLLARSSSEIQTIAAEIREAGGQAEAMRCDVTAYADVEAAVTHCRAAFGRVDILINNAGLIEPIARLAESDPVAWVTAADVNYKGVYHGLRAVFPAMLEQGSGVVVNISSGAATGTLEGWSHYNSSKAAALSLTRCADAEYRGKGIRVVGFSPGTVATGMQVAIKASGLNPVSQLDPSAHSDPMVPARLIAWLCTDEASDYAGTDVSIQDEMVRQRSGLDAAEAVTRTTS